MYPDLPLFLLHASVRVVVLFLDIPDFRDFFFFLVLQYFTAPGARLPLREMVVARPLAQPESGSQLPFCCAVFNARLALLRFSAAVRALCFRFTQGMAK